MLPLAETTTQKVGEAHEMFWTGLAAVPSSTRASCPQVVPSNRVDTPAVFTEAQNVGEVHDTSYCPPVGPVDAGPTAVEIVQVEPLNRTACCPSNATQNVGVGQETELSAPFGVTKSGGSQLVPFQTSTLPDPSTAAQNTADGHETL